MSKKFAIKQKLKLKKQEILTARRDRLQEVGRTIKSQIGDKGFILLMKEPDITLYMACCDRGDAINLMTEWLKKWAVSQQKQSVTVPESEEDPFSSYDRVNLERLCATVGQNMNSAVPTCLFVFDFGTNGNCAHWTDIPEVHQFVYRWLRDQKRGYMA